jgi:DNA-binding transcriptional ArsR family regulator
MDAALKAIAEPRRRQILRLVWGGELSAGEIAEHFEVSRPAISQHLRVLKEADLLEERREGTKRLYRARITTVEQLQRFLDDYWTGGLDRLRDVAEAAETAKQATRPSRGGRSAASGTKPT